MTISDLLKIEDSNTSCINLFKEGIFWRVYQASAYSFTKHIKDLKLLKKHYKIVKREVVYAGFPDTILPQIQALSKSKELLFEQHSEKHCSISGIDIDTGFQEWFESVPSQSSDEKGYDQIIQKIRNFPVINKTPLEAHRFLVEIQNEFNNAII